MTILIVGDNPDMLTGVVNYTRPLAEALSNYAKVVYLYNCTRTGNFDFGGTRIEERKLGKRYKCFELVNGKAGYRNYEALNLDHDDWFDARFSRFLDDHTPDVVHVHEIFGFSSSIIRLCTDRRIRTYVTIHEYWWLCAHRVMVDYNRRICDGPADMIKCAHCVSHTLKTDPYWNTRNRQRIKNSFPAIVNTFKKLKGMASKGHGQGVFNLLPGNEPVSPQQNPALIAALQQRLAGNVENLNLCRKVIAVSSDVKRILVAYGVNPDGILVQHIGSSVADQSIVHTKAIDETAIVFGFIGGVTYYKGVHQLIDAFIALPESLKSRARIEIWGKYDNSYVDAINNDCIGDDKFRHNIQFFGPFTAGDISNITNRLDVSVLPSLCADTAPQTIFESFSAGLPIIAPEIGGFPDFVKNGSNGLTYPAADTLALSKCMAMLIEEPHMISDLRRNIPSLKTIRANAAELVHLYREH